MKKINRILTLLLSIVCLFSLFGCSWESSDGYYVEDSLDTDISYFSSLKSVSSVVSFNVYLPEAKRYDVSYTLVLYYKGQAIGQEMFNDTCSSTGDESAKISEYWSCDIELPGNVKEEDMVIEVKDVIVTVKSTTAFYSRFAIGFGVAGGVILICITALFIFLKKQEKTEPTA